MMMLLGSFPAQQSEALFSPGEEWNDEEEGKTEATFPNTGKNERKRMLQGEKIPFYHL